MTYNNTNFWDVLVVALTYGYVLCLFAGTSYLVGWKDWSPWWFVLTCLIAGSVKIKTGG